MRRRVVYRLVDVGPMIRLVGAGWSVVLAVWCERRLCFVVERVFDDTMLDPLEVTNESDLS